MIFKFFLIGFLCGAVCMVLFLLMHKLFGEHQQEQRRK